MRRRILLAKSEETYEVTLTYSSATVDWWSSISNTISSVKVNGSYYSGDFTVRSNQSWLTARKSGSSIIVDVNSYNTSTSSTRTAIVTVSLFGQSLQITITQRINDSRGTNGNYEWVDLDLPSVIKWATCNVGASKEYNPGYYYQYGKGANQYRNTSGGTIYTGTSTTLPYSLDTAKQVMGGSWRMPTSAECEALIDQTTYTWETDFNGSGVNGGKFTSKTNPNAYVLFPAADYYKNGSFTNDGSYGFIWTSTPDGSGRACCLYFDSGSKTISYSGRYYGRPVRGVFPKDGRVIYNGYEYVDLGLPSVVFWATYNVGASSETDYGEYYTWGSLIPYEDGGTPWTGTTTLPLSADTAYNERGEETIGGFSSAQRWCIPSKLTFEELRAYTDYTWETNFKGSGVNGGKFTSKIIPNAYVFFPAGGEYVGGSLNYVGTEGEYWASTRYDNSFIDRFSFTQRKSELLYDFPFKSFSVRPILVTLLAYI